MYCILDTGMFLGLQKASPALIPGTAFVLSILAAGIAYLLLDANLRIALYFMIVLYLISVGYLSCFAAEEL